MKYKEVGNVTYFLAITWKLWLPILNLMVVEIKKAERS